MESNSYKLQKWPTRADIEEFHFEEMICMLKDIPKLVSEKGADIAFQLEEDVEIQDLF